MTTQKVGIYVRSSIAGPSASAQLTELREGARRFGWTVVVELTDEGLGSKRPGFARLLRLIQRREIDVVMASDLARFGGSLQAVVGFINELNNTGIGLYVPGVIDTQKPDGRVALGVFAALKDYEKQLASERIHCGLARARTQGKRLGRPSVANSPGVAAAVRVLRDRGLGIRKISKTLHIGCHSTLRILGASDA
jgi:DNA invertase Pin-like site-specific DNA recombinase